MYMNTYLFKAKGNQRANNYRFMNIPFENHNNLSFLLYYDFYDTPTRSYSASSFTKMESITRRRREDGDCLYTTQLL